MKIENNNYFQQMYQQMMGQVQNQDSNQNVQEGKQGIRGTGTPPPPPPPPPPPMDSFERSGVTEDATELYSRHQFAGLQASSDITGQRDSSQVEKAGHRPPPPPPPAGSSSDGTEGSQVEKAGHRPPPPPPPPPAGVSSDEDDASYEDYWTEYFKNLEDVEELNPFFNVFNQAIQ